MARFLLIKDQRPPRKMIDACVADLNSPMRSLRGDRETLV